MFLILLTIGLFIALLVSFALLIVPERMYGTSPTLIAIDTIKRKMGKRLEKKGRKEKLVLIGKELDQLIKTGTLIGLCLAFLLGLVAYLFFPLLTPIAIILGLILGVFLVEFAIENEYKAYQAKMAQGTLPLAGFMPAFLEAEGVTPREALTYSLPFIPNPLRGELDTAVSRIARTGRVHEAMEALTNRVKDPIVDAICFRMATAWDAKVTADIFDDLGDQLEILEELAVSKETASKTGFLALISVLGLIGVLLVYGYPGMQYLAEQMGGFM